MITLVKHPVYAVNLHVYANVYVCVCGVFVRNVERANKTRPTDHLGGNNGGCHDDGLAIFINRAGTRAPVTRSRKHRKTTEVDDIIYYCTSILRIIYLFIMIE